MSYSARAEGLGKYDEQELKAKRESQAEPSSQVQKNKKEEGDPLAGLTYITVGAGNNNTTSK